MCYCNCPYEFYPNGPNEGCACRKPKGVACLFDIPEKVFPVSCKEEDDDDDVEGKDYGN